MSYASLPASSPLLSAGEGGPSLWHSVASSNSLGKSRRENPPPRLDLEAIMARWVPLALRLGRAARELAEDLFDDEVPPSDRAVKEGVARLMAAATRFSSPSEFPMPQLTTSGDGSLTCEWPGATKRIVLFVSRDGEPRLSTYERTSDGDLRVDDVPKPSGLDLERLIRSYP
jgi:hypothetical protein